MASLPKEVPFLSAQDMCIGPLYDSVQECGCLAHWHDRVFWERENVRGEDLDAVRKALVMAHDILNTALAGKGVYFTMPGDVGKITEEEAARVWNVAMGLLGYTEGNPECDSEGNIKALSGR